MKPDPLLIVGGGCLVAATFLPWFGLFGLIPGAALNSLSVFEAYRILIFTAGLLLLANGIRPFSRFWTFTGVWLALLVGLAQIGLMTHGQQGVLAPSTGVFLEWFNQLKVHYTHPAIGLYLIFGGAVFGLFGLWYAVAFPQRRPLSVWDYLFRSVYACLLTLFIIFYPNLSVYQALREGRSYEAGGQTDRAIAVYRQALATPTLIDLPLINADLCENYGLLCYRLGHLDDAVVFLQKTLQYRPAAFPAIKALGLIAYAQGHEDEAITYLATAFRINSSDADVLDRLARLYIGREEWVQAIAMLNRLSEQNPNNPATKALLGKLYLKQGDYNQARLFLEQSLAIAEAQREVHADLGQALLYQQEWLEAARHFKRATELGWQESQLPEKMRGWWNQYIAPLF